jgi:hypothetical protein
MYKPSLLQNTQNRSIAEAVYVPIPGFQHFARPVVSCCQYSDASSRNALPRPKKLPDLMPTKPMHPLIVILLVRAAGPELGRE